jgi:surface polysaccharide O-acyltransferase-like enzyme
MPPFEAVAKQKTGASTTGDGPGRGDRPRYGSIDVLKATAIVAVIWIHSFLVTWQPQAGVIRWLGSVTRFAVPGFFFASGFLYFQHHRAPLGVIARRLQRVAVPYLVASLIAIVGRWVYAGPIPLREIVFELATGDAVGIYYFIPPFIGAVLLVIVLARYRRLVVPLLALLWGLGFLCERGVIWIKAPPGAVPFFWNQRNPLRWWGYFVAGWCLANYAGVVSRLSPRARTMAGAVLLGVALGCSLAAVAVLPPGKSTVWVSIEYLNIYACILGLFLLAFDWPDVPGVRWLSEATYPIYLYHFFFISLFRVFLADSLRQRLALPPAALNSMALVVGLSGGLVTVWIGRWVFGRHARLVIG